MTQLELFKTKEQQLEEWCRERGFFSKAEIMQYALNNFYLRADRTIRDFVTQGKVRHLSQDECIFRNLQGKMAWYEYEH